MFFKVLAFPVKSKEIGKFRLVPEVEKSFSFFFDRKNRKWKSTDLTLLKLPGEPFITESMHKLQADVLIKGCW